MHLLEGLLADVRYAVRLLRAKPAFTTVAILSLALGIGANTAIFTLIDAAILRPLPVKDPSRLVLLSDPDAAGVGIGTQGGTRSLLSHQEFERLRDRTSVFSGLFAAESSPDRLNVSTGTGPAEPSLVKLVSGEYFPVLGVAPLVGRTFTPADEKGPGSNPVAVLGYAFWQRKFGGDTAALGKTLRIGKTQLTVIGVMPQGFFGETVGSAPDAWVSMSMQPAVMPGRFWLRDDESKVERVMWLHVMGRLKPGVTRQQAQANVSVVFADILKTQAALPSDPAARRDLLNQKIEVRQGAKGASTVREGFSEPLLVLMGMVALVLLIACANVANLLLARAASRQKEIGVRLAIGAGRGRLIRQTLTESVVLALAGGLAGLVLAYWGTDVLLRLVSGPDGTIPLDTAPDLRILGFTAALSILTGLLFGLAPALRAGASDPGIALKENSRGLTLSGGHLGTGRALVAGQVAVSLLLLIVAGLFVRTLANLKQVDLGYSPDKLLSVRVDALAAGYRGPVTLDLFRRIAERLGALPGVRSVSYSGNGLFTGSEMGDKISVEGYKPARQGDDLARFDQVSPSYFSTVGIPIRLGRGIEPQDTTASRRVCVINQTMARFYFGDRNPIGKRVTDEFPDNRTTFEVVGVVTDAKDHDLRGEVQRRFYLPADQPLGPEPASTYFLLRTSADPGAMVQPVRRAIQEIDRNLPILNAQTLGRLLYDSVQQDRIVAQLAGFFGAVALLLASVGIYGVLSYAIARRTNEIGIRMALGADAGRLVRMVLRETLLLVIAGAACGIPLTLAASRVFSSRLYGLSAADPLTLASAVAVLGAIALLAGYVPARRAAQVDPVVALRSE